MGLKSLQMEAALTPRKKGPLWPGHQPRAHHFTSTWVISIEVPDTSQAPTDEIVICEKGRQLRRPLARGRYFQPACLLQASRSFLCDFSHVVMERVSLLSIFSFMHVQ